MIASVVAIAKGGCGIVRAGDKTVFLPGVVAGETVEFSLAGKLRSAWQGKLLRVLDPSPQRIEPPCPHARECGGCNLQHMAYDEQLRCKVGIFLANLKKIACLDLPAPPGILASPPSRYRSKCEFQVRSGISGFFARDSHRVVEIGSCLLLPRPAEEFLLTRRRDFASARNGQLQVVSNGEEIAACFQNDAGDVTWPSGRRDVTIPVGPYAYRVSPRQFVQANLFQLGSMLGLLEAALAVERPERGADLFCGGGFFTLPLARRCRETWALESDPENLAALRANLAQAGAGHVRVAQADVLRHDLPAADLYVVDPPRGGLSAALIAALAGERPGAVVYFSCDSATFARDLRQFMRHGYGPKELKLIDNFPHSDHFEIFSLLKRTELNEA